MKRHIFPILAICCLYLLLSCQQDKPAATEKAAPKTAPITTAAEKETGEWTVLFDGISGAHWRKYGTDHFPDSGWTVNNGALVLLPKSGGGDIMTKEKYQNFDLQLEFMAAKGANSGILYLVQEIEGQPMYMSAPEYQIIDDANYIKISDGDPAVTKHHLTADNYDLQTATNKKLNPAGEWNTARIVINKGHVEHYLNGAKVVEYDLRSPEWEAMVQASKFADWEEYAKADEGHIGLQDHGDMVSFRNIRIKRL